MTKMTGVETFNVKNSTGKVTITNANSATMALSFEGSSTNDIKAGYKAGTLSGTADKLAVSLNTASAVKVETDAGFESAEITVNGKSDIDAWTTPGVTTVTLKGSGNLDIATGLMTGIETLSAADYTGNLTTGSVVAATGFISGTITGSANGTVMTLGSGADNIGVIDASAGTKSTTVKLGAGDDKVTVNAAGNAIYVFGEAGNDSINAVTTALSSADVIDGGEGTDTLYLDGSLANNAMVLKSIEKAIISGTGSAQTFTNDDSATIITWQVDNSAVNLVNLTAGSTVTAETKTNATTKTAGAVTVGFEEVEAANTIEVKSGMTGALTLSKITAATVNLGAASDLGAVITTNDAQSLTINATGALSATTGQNIVDGTATDVLKTVTVTGTDLVKVGTVTSTVMETVNVTAAKALTVGNIGADSEKLDSVTLTATAGALAMGNIGKTTGTNTLDVTINAKDAITVTGGAIESTKIGNISATSTAGAVTLGAIASTATQIGDITVNAKGNVSVGLIGHATEVATSVGTISMTSTDGYIYAADINTKDADGITVNMTAKTTIDKSNGSTAATVENVGGNITASLAGAAAAYVDYKGKVVNLTATNTGGLTSTVTNAATAGDGSTSTITLGNTTTTNAITIDGTVDTINITGGTGTDTVKFGTTDAIKNGTISLGGGSSDSIDFSGLAITNTKGLAMNFSSSTIYFGEGSANVSSIASGKVAAYDAANYAGSTTAANKAIIADGQNFTVSGVETVVGTATADYIAVANTGMTVTGGAGADVIILSAGVDTIKGLEVANQSIVSTARTFADATSIAANDTITFGNGVDIVKNFTSGTDKLDGTAVNAAPTTLIGVNSTTGLADGTAYVLYGTYNAETKAFTAAAAYNATTAKDALVVEGDGTQTVANEQDFILLTGLNQALVAADFI